MKIRMKKAWFDGYRQTGKPIKDDPVLSGCKHEEERSVLKEKYKAGELSETEYYDARTTLFGSKSTKIGRKVHAPAIINMTLEHGDMVVMHGRDIQNYYEVSTSSIT
jgi:hypothetical protein